MKGLKFGKNLGLRNIILQGDALKIVHAFRKEEQSWSKSMVI